MYIMNHVNVYGSCLGILRVRGWAVSATTSPYESEDWSNGSFTARREGVKLVADNPLELLGLTMLAEHSTPTREPYWWRVDSDGEFARIRSEAIQLAFWCFRDRKPWAWAEEVLAAHAQAEVSPADALGVSDDDARRAKALLSCEDDVGTLLIQLHPEEVQWRYVSGDLGDWLGTQATTDVRCVDTDTDCVSFFVRCDEPERVWQELGRFADERRGLRQALVVAFCTAPGWTRHVLLAHFDPTKSTSPFPVTAT